jgi:hypothetical protein
VTIVTSPSSGWIFLWLDDPVNTSYILTKVVRSDGREVKASFEMSNTDALSLQIALNTNAWRTYRVIHRVGGPEVLSKLNILDFNSTNSYTLVYSG